MRASVTSVTSVTSLRCRAWPALPTLLMVASTAGFPGDAQSASSAPLEVTATMTPAACTPALSAGGVVHYGLMNAGILKTGQVTRLPAVTMTFTVNCDAAAMFRVVVIDNRSASVVPGIVADGSGNGALGDDYNFGLGKETSDRRSVGGYSISFVSGSYTGDYQPVQLMSSQDNQTWSSAASTFVSHRLSYAWGNGGNTVEPYRTLSAGISVQPYINKAENLNLNGDIVLDGSATLELHYL